MNIYTYKHSASNLHWQSRKIMYQTQCTVDIYSAQIPNCIHNIVQWPKLNNVQYNLVREVYISIYFFIYDTQFLFHRESQPLQYQSKLLGHLEFSLLNPIANKSCKIECCGDKMHQNVQNVILLRTTISGQHPLVQRWVQK